MPFAHVRHCTTVCIVATQEYSTFTVTTITVNMKHPGQPSEVAPPAQSPSKESKSESDPTTTTALADSPKKKSTLNPGVYTLINAQSGTVIDLSVMDHKTVVGFPRHNGDNQQVGSYPVVLL